MNDSIPGTFAWFQGCFVQSIQLGSVSHSSRIKRCMHASSHLLARPFHATTLIV